MEKKLLLIIAICSLAILMTSSGRYQDPDFLELSASIIDPTEEHDDNPKSPILIPSVSLDDHTLYFATPCDGCTLNIVDSNDVVVYTTVIPTGATSLVLPATLSGEYELQIISAGYLFYGTIDLP